MKIGLIGRLGSGRATLFDALTNLRMRDAPRQPGKTRLGVARVHDPRIDRLTELCSPKKTVYAEFTLAIPSTTTLDVAALGEMRDLRAYAQIVGAFSGQPIVEAVTEQVDELRTEMLLVDQDRVERRRARITKGGGDRPGEKAALERAFTLLEAEKLLRMDDWSEQEFGLLSELGLVSHRPLLTVVNVAEDQAGEAPSPDVQGLIERIGSEMMWLSAPLELEISELDAEAQAEFLGAYGLQAPVSQRFSQACLDLLDQICFFTVGPDEVRAWPIARHTHAKRAARAIHSDLERGFIRAEVIDYGVLIELGSEAKCRSTGQLRTEGKDYIVVDGDIINVRFNV